MRNELYTTKQDKKRTFISHNIYQAKQPKIEKIIMEKQKDMGFDDFERFMSNTCNKLKLLSKDKLAVFTFTIARCANYWYENNKIK